MSTDFTDTILEWESKGLSNEKIKPLVTVNHSLQKLRWMNILAIRVKLKEGCLKQDKINFGSKKCSKFMSWDLNANFILKDCFFGAFN